MRAAGGATAWPMPSLKNNWSAKPSAQTCVFVFFKQKTAYEITYGDWSSDVCSSDLLATMHDGSGHVAIEGFYDKVVDWGDAARDEIRALPFDEEHFRAETGASSLGGETGFSTLERLWMRPTCEINGLLSGYTGEGAKTVLPSKAMAKVSCRLVPDQ